LIAYNPTKLGDNIMQVLLVGVLN